MNNIATESNTTSEIKVLSLLHSRTPASRMSERLSKAIWAASFLLVIAAMAIYVNPVLTPGFFVAAMTALHVLWAAHSWIHTNKALLSLNVAMLMLDFYAIKGLV